MTSYPCDSSYICFASSVFDPFRIHPLSWCARSRQRGETLTCSVCLFSGSRSTVLLTACWLSNSVRLDTNVVSAGVKWNLNTGIGPEAATWRRPEDEQTEGESRFCPSIYSLLALSYSVIDILCVPVFRRSHVG